MIEFKQIKDVNGFLHPTQWVLIDGQHVGYWGTHDGADMTLLNGLCPSESEQQQLDDACMQARGFKPKIIVQPARKGKG